MAQGQDEHDEADAITEQTYGARTKQRRPRWQRGSERQRERGVYRPGDGALDGGNLHGVAARYRARQIIVDGPAQTRTRNPERAP